MTWDTLIARQRGAFAIEARNLRTNASITHDQDRRVEAASTIKLLVLCCLLRNTQDSKLSLHDLVHIAPEDIVPAGSGLLQHIKPRAPFELQHLALLMMSVSDNIATNTIIRCLGKQKVNEYAAEIGLRETQLLVGRLDFKTKTEEGFRLGVTTAHEMAQLLEMLATGRLLDARHTTVALDMLGAVQGSTFARRINITPLKSFGSKMGWLYSPSRSLMILNECGVFTDDSGAVSVFAIYSALPLDRRKPYSLDSSSRHAFARVAEAIFRELSR